MSCVLFDLENDLFNRSKTLKREVFAELSYHSQNGVETPILLAEQIGYFENIVPAHRTSNGSIVLHTHLNQNPPSDADYVMMIRSQVTNNSIEHRVINDEYVFNYKCSVALYREMAELVKCDFVDLLRDRLNQIRFNVITINEDYRQNKNPDLYVRSIKDLGINLSYRSRNNESSF